MKTGGLIDGWEAVEEAAQLRSFALYESLRFFTYIIFDTLKHLITKPQIHYMDIYNIWEKLNQYRFSTDIEDLHLWFKNLPDSVPEDLNIFRTTEPWPLVIHVLEDADVATKRICYLVIVDNHKGLVFMP